MADDRASDARAFGLEAPKEEAPQVCEVWEEHWPALEVFLACRTQWRVIAGMGGAQHQGIEYTALESVMRMKGVDDPAAMLEQIQCIEAGALEALNAD